MSPRLLILFLAIPIVSSCIRPQPATQPSQPAAMAEAVPQQVVSSPAPSGPIFVASIPSGVGPGRIPAMLEMCNSDDANLRLDGINGLMQLPEARTDGKFTKVIVEAMSDPSLTIRKSALRWVTTTLTDPSPEVVGRVAELLASSIAAANANGGTILSSADRQAAIEVLRSIPAQPELSVKAQIANLSDRADDVRLAALTALRSYGDGAKQAMPRLKQLLASGSEVESAAAAELLLGCGREGRQAVVPYYLHQLYEHEAPPAAAVKAIAEVGPDAADAVPLLQKHLVDQDNDLRIDVANALGQIGPAARSAIPGLVRMVDNADGNVRQSASAALIKISPDGKGLSPALMAAVYNGDRNAVLRLSAVLQHADEARAVVNRLNDLAGNDPDAKVRAAARQAVVSLSPDP